MSVILEAFLSLVLWAASLLGHSTPDTAPPAPSVAVQEWEQDTASDFPQWSDGTYACGEEDGSTPGQPFPCRWEAAEQGNGHGRTFTLQGPAG